MTWTIISKRFFFFFVFSVAFLLSLFGNVLAQDSGVADGETFQTNPKSRETSITATVIPPNPPPYPVLVRPSNNAILTSGVVVFEWEQPSGHPQPLSRYELYLNGSVKFGQIHITDQTTDDYVLTVTDGNKYRLALKQDKWLADGSYTWKIRVIDVNDRGSDSTTWSFLIDSTPPNILITEIDGTTTAISAADPTTIPTDPIIVTHSDPVIEGHTEDDSEVQLVVTFADGSVVRYKTAANDNGRFTFSLEDLPANQSVTLTFTAIDLAGLTRVLDGVKLMYQPKKIVITLPPIFPQPVVLTLYVWQPGLPRTFLSAVKDLPPPFGPLITRVLEPAEAPTQLIEVPIFPVGKVAGVWLLLVFGYIVAVFILTRNHFSYFLPYVVSFVRFWFLGSKGQYRWIEGGGSAPLVLYGYMTSWLDDANRFHRTHNVASPLGTWSVPFVSGRTISIQSDHILYPFPFARTTIKEVPDGVVLSQEGLSFKEGTALKRTEAALLVNEKEKVIAVTAPIQRSGWPQLLTFVPRVILILTLVCAFWLLWNAKTWLTIFIIIFTLWIFVRDVQVSLRQRLEVYAP